MNRGNVIIAALAVVGTLGAAVAMEWDQLVGPEPELVFSEQMSLKQVAMANGIEPPELKFKLGHDLPEAKGLPMQKPIGQLGVPAEKIRDVVEHIRGEDSPWLSILKYGLWAGLLSAVMLGVLSRKDRIRWRTWILVGSVVVFGVALGVSPNPMESVVKLFKWIAGIQSGALAVALSFVAFTVLSLWAAKFICSWGCHLGALQESLYNLPLLRKHRWRPPFWLSLGVRVVVFTGFAALLFGLGSFVVYHHVNYFKVFRFPQLARVALLTLPVLVIASLFIFRPFCQFICPFGLWAWVLENATLRRIRIREARCVHCERCVRECPTEAMKRRYAGERRFFLPDCWTCGKCIEVCPTNAVELAGPGDGRSQETVKKKDDSARAVS